ncbi:MAG: BA14K family protein [Alphaproteobacteria bacterium]|nr:BA14K family protein [Alphaproteobacteria bacterium]
MRKLMILALGAALVAGAPMTASAQADHRPGMGQPGGHPGMNNQDMGRGPQDHGQPNMDHSPYGQWNMGWGHRPPAPPKHFKRHDNWYQHVRACTVRYRSYNPRTDLYMVRRGVMARCRL